MKIIKDHRPPQKLVVNKRNMRFAPELFLGICFFVIVTTLPAIFNDYEPSARARAMSGAVTSFNDDFAAIFYNPAGLRLAETQVGASYYHLLGNDFSTVSTFSGSYDSRYGTFGCGWQAMNVEAYKIHLMSENKFSLGHSLYLVNDVHSKVSFGYSFNLYSLSFHELGNDYSVGLNAGVIAILHQRTSIGFMLTNINKPTIGELNHEIPQQFAVGLSYIPYQGVITAIDLKKNFEGDTELRSGVEVEIHPNLKLRMGIRNNPASYSAGAGINYLGVYLDYGLSSHATLDLTHHFGISYKF